MHDAGAGRPAVPEHSGRPQGVQRISKGARRGVFEGTGAIVTKTLVAINIAVYVITAAQGAGINSPGGSLFNKWLLFGPAVANGDWWRLITSCFLHASLIHIAFNMYFLWFVGSRSRWRSAADAFCSSTSSPGWRAPPVRSSTRPTRRRWGPRERSSGSSARRSCSSGSATSCSAARLSALVLINLVLSFAISGISIGGHIGGLIGGALCTLVLSHFGRGHAAYSRVGLWGIAGVLGVGLLSIAVAYWQVRGYA